MIYAIVESGGKQYKAVEGAFLEVDLLSEDLGQKKVFNKVLLIANDSETLIGSPYLNNASIDATVTEHYKGSKIVIFKYRPKERYRVKTGHRQRYTRLLVDSIEFPGKPKVEKEADTALVSVKKTRSKNAKPLKTTPEKGAIKTKTVVEKKSPKTQSTTKKTSVKTKAAPKKSTANTKPAAAKSTKKVVKKSSSLKEKK